MIKAKKDITAAINGRKYAFKKGETVQAPPAVIELLGDAVEESKAAKEKEKADD